MACRNDTPARGNGTGSAGGVPADAVRSGGITFEEYKARLSGQNTLGKRVRRNLSYTLLLLVIVAVVGFVLSRLVIVVLVPISWWMAILLLVGIIIVLFLVLDRFIPD